MSSNSTAPSPVAGLTEDDVWTAMGYGAAMLIVLMVLFVGCKQMCDRYGENDRATQKSDWERARGLKKVPELIDFLEAGASGRVAGHYTPNDGGNGSIPSRAYTPVRPECT
jgi:hypothetical protein